MATARNRRLSAGVFVYGDGSLQALLGGKARPPGPGDKECDSALVSERQGSDLSDEYDLVSKDAGKGGVR